MRHSQKRRNKTQKKIFGKSKKMIGGSQTFVQSAQYPNVYNTVGYNVNLGNPNFDPSDPTNQISSRLLLNGGSKKKHQNKKRKSNRKRRTIKGGMYSLLGSSEQLNGINAFGSSVGGQTVRGIIAGTPENGGIPVTYNRSITNTMPLV